MIPSNKQPSGVSNDRPTIPAPESVEEAALSCVRHGNISITDARHAIDLFRQRHGYSWLSVVNGGAS